MPLARRSDLGDSNYAGLEVDACDDLPRCLGETLECGFDFLVVPLALRPRDRRPAPSARDPRELTPPPPPFHSDLLLNSTQWSSQVVGKTSRWIDADALDAAARRDGEAALRQELMWAAHLSLHAVLLPDPPGGLRLANYARIVNQFLASLSNTALWVRVPVVARPEEGATGGGDAMDDDGPTTSAPSSRDPFAAWAKLRAMCEGHPQLGACLEVGAQLPSEEDLARWIGEPLRAVALSPDAFVANKRGFPVLPKRHQEFVQLAMRRNVQVIVTDPPPGDVDNPGENVENDPTPAEAASRETPPASSAEGSASSPGANHRARKFWEYVVYLFRKIDPTSEQELAEASYRDYLQAPLQPLMDNLESATYEVFEKDASKYIQYEEAVLACLTDRVSDADAKAGKKTTLMVVGAGRGPLVKASLRASARCGRKLRVYAVEKNPNAIVTLQSLKASEGWDDETVTIVASDMREWDGYAEKADVLVSELLGSFGDNELSPECLDGAQRFLKPDGVSIPSAYTSYLAPMTCAKLWNDAKAHGDLAHMETPYVVKLHRCALLAPPERVFTFVHPNRDPVIDNSRYAVCRFEPYSADSTMHGFAGYFDATLYDGPAGKVSCSIYPPTHTLGPTNEPMFTWFPIYFPLRTPVDVPAGKGVEAHVWRCVGKGKVWYEWAVTEPGAGPVHNVNGRSYWVGL